MIRRLILTITALASSVCAMAVGPIHFDLIKREAPNLDEIREKTYDRDSPYYYPRLMAEYERNDTVMKLDKYRYLYLGYMFREDYNPYRESSSSQSPVLNIDFTRMTHQQCDSVISSSEQALADNPFDLVQMELLISALRTRGKVALADIWQYKFNYILMTIVSTGTGLDEENAWYIIEPQHEYVLLNKMGMTITNHIFYEPYYEYLKVKADGQGTGGIYFNIEGILQEYFRKFPEEL